MRIKKINTTGGPNYWSIKKTHLVVMELDLEELESRPTDQIDGFYSRLKQAFPSLHDHHCSEGEPGGFLKRVKHGTWMGHVIEHLALELQVLAGLEVGFGRTRGTGKKGHYFVVFECEDRDTGRRTAELAVAVAKHLINGTEFDPAAEVEKVRDMSLRYAPGPSTGSLLREADARGIPSIKLEESCTYQLGYGCRQQKIAATIASTTANMGVDLADNKEASRQLFEHMFIPVATGGVLYRRDDVEDFVRDTGFPLVMKPVSGNQGRGVTIKIQNVGQALKAFDTAAKISDGVVVERYIPGSDFRVLVINHKVAAAAKRTPPHVVGDGTSTIEQLVDEVNRHPKRGTGHNKALTRIAIDTTAKRILRNRDVTTSTVLPEGERLKLNHAANLSVGGTAEDVTDTLHPDVIVMAERLSKMAGLDICGIDIMASNLQEPLDESGGVVLEVNAAPGFRMHLSPSKGKSRNVAAPVLDMLFPENIESRIPIIAITGTNGKTTTTRLIAHIMETDGRRVGFTTTDGIYVNGQRLMKADCGGPKSAKCVLRDPTVDTAVLECARGGILREGLGFDRCDVGVVTNVSSDHLGLKGIDTLEKMARVKSVVPESVHHAGHAVLNADDDRVYAMRHNIRCDFVLFSANADNLRLLKHRQTGGICVTSKNGSITIWHGKITYKVQTLKEIPLSFGGRATFMVENIVAAAAAAYAQGIEPEVIGEALKEFKPSAEQTPGRMNLFDFNDFDVMIDYAHNAAGFRGIKEFLSAASYKSTMGIITSMGDRREEDNQEVGRLAAEIFDTVIIREDTDLRGRAPGEMIEIIKKGITDSGNQPNVIAIRDEKEALAYALNHARPGSFILHCTEKVDDILDFTKKRQHQMNKHQLTLQKNRSVG